MFNVFDHRRFFLQQFYTRGIHFLLYVDVKIWATKGDQRARQHVYWTLTAHGNKKANSVEESLEDCRDLATNRKHVTNRTGSKRKPSTSAWQKDTLLNCWMSDNLCSHIMQVCRSIQFINRDFSLPYWMISLSVSVRSTEEFSRSVILFQIHFCIWKKSTSVKKNMKSTQPSPEINSIWLFVQT